MSQIDCQALVQPGSDPSAPFFYCWLAFWYKDDPRQATLSLSLEVFTTEVSQSFVLEYAADNIGTGRLSRSSGIIKQFSEEQLAQLKQGRQTDFQILYLEIKKECPVWCPVDERVDPQCQRQPTVSQFKELSRASILRILFDYKHVQQQHQGMFKAFRQASRGLVGHPLTEDLVQRGLKKATSDAFDRANTISDVSPPAFAETCKLPDAFCDDNPDSVAPLVTEVFPSNRATRAPPQYQVASTHKRFREESPSSPLYRPKYRTPNSPTGSHSSEKTVLCSPEVAAAAFKRARNEFINAAVEKQLTAHVEEIKAQQAREIDAAVAKRLKGYIGGALHVQTVEAAVSRQVDAAVKSHLPSAIEDLFVPDSQPASPAPSFTSIDSSGHNYPKLPKLTPFGQTMLPHLRTHLTNQFKLYQQQELQRFERLVNKKYDEVESAAYDARVKAQGEFEEDMEIHKADVLTMQQDTVDDLWTEGGKVLEQGRDVCLDFGEDLLEKLSQFSEEIDRLHKYALRKMVMAEVSKQKRRRKGIPKGWGRNMLRGEHKLLGRRREVEEEWKDIECGCGLTSLEYCL